MDSLSLGRVTEKTKQQHRKQEQSTHSSPAKTPGLTGRVLAVVRPVSVDGGNLAYGAISRLTTFQLERDLQLKAALRPSASPRPEQEFRAVFPPRSPAGTGQPGSLYVRFHGNTKLHLQGRTGTACLSHRFVLLTPTYQARGTVGKVSASRSLGPRFNPRLSHT